MSDKYLEDRIKEKFGSDVGGIIIECLEACKDKTADELPGCLNEQLKAKLTKDKLDDKAIEGIIGILGFYVTLG